MTSTTTAIRQRYFCCYRCKAEFFEHEADIVSVPDDRDQMYGRPLGGRCDVLACPDCGEIDDIAKMERH